MEEKAARSKAVAGCDGVLVNESEWMQVMFIVASSCGVSDG